jgi:SAM-dependent methyltransferase
MAMFSAVDAYDRYVGRYSPQLARAVADAAGVVSGQRVLDVGCGTGALTFELVRRVGAAGVAAVDPSPSFVDACRARNPGVDVQVAAAESLPFPEGSFDSAIAQLVVHFMTDAVAGVGEMRRVTRPGGSVVGAVWDYLGGMTLIQTFWSAAAALDASVDVAQEQRRRYTSAGELRDLWIEVGLRDVAVKPADVAADYDDFADLWQPIEAGAGPVGAYVTRLHPDGRARLREEFRTRLGRDERTAFSLTARAWIVVGRR